MTRTPSQNVAFCGESHGDDSFEPPGPSIARALLTHLRHEEFTASEEDNWRDCGWSIDVTFPDVVLQLAIARIKPDCWIGQVAPLNEPGVFRRLLGQKFVDHSARVLSVARAVHHWLEQSGFNEVWWRIDGFPDAAHGSREPISQGAESAV
jgi:hypothetical protein